MLKLQRIERYALSNGNKPHENLCSCWLFILGYEKAQLRVHQDV